MPSKKQVINHTPITGLNKDSHLGLLQKGEYTNALNSNIQSKDGSGYFHTSDPSNLLTTEIKSNFKVVGVAPNKNKNEVYLFLTNPTTKVSEIGKVEMISDMESMDEESSYIHELNTQDKKLSEITDIVGFKNYTTIISDCPENLCLNFDINKPIHTIKIRNEVSGTKITWTFGDMPMTLDLGKLDELNYTGHDICDEDTKEPICLDCNKLKVFRDYSPIVLEEETLIEGSLGKAKYQFFAAYSTKDGVAETEFHSQTTPINLNDVNKTNIDIKDLEASSGNGIKLSIKNIDNSRDYFKVAMAKTSLGGTRYYEVGVYNIATKSIVVNQDPNTSSQYKELSSEDIFLNKTPHYRTSERIEEVDGSLTHLNVSKQKELNLQPVVNLMGFFAEWATIEVTEDFYKTQIPSEKAKSHMRDEVKPFSISFLFKNGFETAQYPLISRPAISEGDYNERRSVFYPDNNGKYTVDGQKVSVNPEDKKVVESILDGMTNCAESERKEHWQYYNTAGEGSIVPGYQFSDNKADGDSYAYVLSQNVGTIEDPRTKTGSFPNPCNTSQSISYGFNFVLNSNVFGDYFGINYTLDNFVDEIKAFCKEGSNLNDSDKTILYLKHILLSDYTNSPNYEGEPDRSIFGQTPDCGSGNDGVCCDEPERLPNNDKILFDEIINETPEIIYRDIEDYRSLPEPATCEILFKNSEGKTEFTDFQEEGWIRNGNNKPFYIFKRIQTNTSHTSDGAATILSESGEIDYILPSYNMSYEAPVPDVTENEGGSETLEQQGRPDYRDLFDTNDRYEPNKLALNWDQPRFSNNAYNHYHGQSITKFAYWHEMDTRFYPGISTNAAWFALNVSDMDSMVLKISRFNLPNIHKDSPFGDYHNRGVTSYRITFYTNLKGNGLVFSEIHSTKSSFEKGMNFTNQNVGQTDQYGFLNVDLELNDVVYVAIDTAITRINTHTNVNDILYDPVTQDAPDPKYFDSTTTDPLNVELVWHNAPEGCFTVAYSDKEQEQTNIVFDNTPINLQETYKAICHYSVPDPNDCNPQLFQKGIFGFNESTQLYPNNKELYDSSNLTITEADVNKSISIGGKTFKQRFEQYCTSGTSSGSYNLKDLDFTCQGIRHFKFPDNSISPVINNFKTAPLANSAVFPIGMSIDEEVVKTFLDIAVKNNLIPQKERENIIGYKVYTGDRSSNKSVISKGLSFDMYKYEEDRDIFFSNFPYNTLGKNVYVQDKNGTTLKHPYNSKRNNRFSIMTPELYNSWQGNPTEVKVEGYMYGSSENKIAEVKEHPKEVILGNKAKSTATALATAEALAEILLDVMSGLEVYRFGFGLSTQLNPAGIAQLVLNISDARKKFYSRMAKYRSQWIDTFRNTGKPINFAYRPTGVGKYTSLSKVPIDANNAAKRIFNNTRGILSSKKIDATTEVISDIKGERDYINNIDREESIYIKTSDFIDYPAEYTNYDNADISEATSGRVTQSNAATTGITIRNVASPYVSLKVFNPSQYGRISDINWLPTGFTKLFGKEEKGYNEVVFGGDTYIARFGDIRKASLFTRNAMNLPDRAPFEYSRYPMYGNKTTYYLDSGINNQIIMRGNLLPTSEDKYNLDAVTNISEFYIEEPSKFYLYAYGIINYMVETEINPFYRYSETTDQKTLFYPQTTDYVRLTEESLIPISSKNTLLYNRVYRQPGLQSIGRTLNNRYNDQEENYKSTGQNTVVISQPNTEDFKTHDPWKVYKAKDLVTYDTSNGKLKDILKLTSNQVVLRFENGMSVVNSQTDIRNQQQLKGASIFSSPKVDFTNSIVGYGGAENISFLHTEFGTVVLDTIRGDIFLLNGKPNSTPELTEISSTFNQKPTYMDKWFQDNLPFHILTSKITNYQDINIDNNFNGIGISMGYDTIHKQVLISKKDFIPLTNGIEYRNGEFYDGSTKLSLQDSNYFEDVSWTISFDFTRGRWGSFFSFIPDFYINTPLYFQTGLNRDQSTIWTHGMTNRSFNTYYNQEYPWMVETPTTFMVTDNRLESVKYMMEAKRHLDDSYHNFIMNERIGMDRAIITGLKSSSGNLNLNPILTPFQRSLYPIKVQGEPTQEIPQTYSRGTWSFNYFYDRLKEGHQIWNHKKDGHSKELINDSHDYQQRTLKRLEDVKGEILLESYDTKHNKQILIELIDATPKTDR